MSHFKSSYRHNTKRESCTSTKVAHMWHLLSFPVHSKVTDEAVRRFTVVILSL